MKTSLLLLAGLVGVVPTLIFAQESPEVLNAPSDAPRRTESQLEQLLGPIALYPDALIAIILPASTYLPDIVLAARYFRTGNDGPQIADQTWDDSVKALAHYPEVVKWMDENFAWTKQLGEAFLIQPTDVMKAVQRLRERARLVGALNDTPQQRVVVTGEELAIEPAQDDVIYVPRYDPEVVYGRRNYNYSGPLLTFGLGLPVGAWLAYDCDWRTRAIWVGRRHEDNHWHATYTGEHSRPIEAHTWRPSPQHYHSAPSTPWSARAEIVHPRPVIPDSPAITRYPANPSTTTYHNAGTTHDHREGFLRDSDGREIHRPSTGGTATPPAALPTPAATVNPIPSVALPAANPNNINNRPRNGEVHREHHENRSEGDGTANVNIQPTTGRFLPQTRVAPTTPSTVPVAPPATAPAPRQEYHVPRAYVHPPQPASSPAPVAPTTPSAVPVALPATAPTPRQEYHVPRAYVRPPQPVSSPAPVTPTPTPTPAPAPAPTPAATAPVAPRTGDASHHNQGNSDDQQRSRNVR